MRTGVTAILPRGKATSGSALCGRLLRAQWQWRDDGLVWIEESGELQTPITITNTHSCGVTRDATIRWLV